jgi:chromosome segregation protein
LAKRRRADLIERECEKLTKRSNAEIRARVRIGAGMEPVIQRLRNAVTGSGLRRDKLDGISAAVEKSENPDALWVKVVGDLEVLAAYNPDESAGKNVPRCKTLASYGFAAADLLKVAAKLDEETWLELSLLRLEDRPMFEHRKREGDYIPFTNASAGRAASNCTFESSPQSTRTSAHHRSARGRSG